MKELAGHKYPDELLDFNPKFWLSKYRKNSVSYLIKMALFYHLLGLGLMYASSAVAYEIIEDYETPIFPVSVISAAVAGPIEEVIFFGLPYYFTGNPLVVLGTGIVWSAVHLFNTESFEINNLAYGGLAFTIPHLFFSLRTWISKKGWFAIAFHSIWNVSVLFWFCGAGLRECLAFNEGEKFIIDLLLIFVAASLCIIMYLIYLRTQEKYYPMKYLIIAAVVLVVVEIPIIIFNFETLFS